MINRAVYTYWTDEGNRFNAGFDSFGGFKRIFSKSLIASKKHYNKVVIYTDEEGKEKLESSFESVLEGIEIQVIDYSVHDFDPRFWNFPKLLTYYLQTEPFLHIDTDVIFYEACSEEELTSEILTELIRPAQIWSTQRKILPKDINEEYDPYLICSGILGGTNLEVFNELFEQAHELVKWDDKRLNVSGHDRIAIEEIILTVLAKRKGVKAKEIDQDKFIHYQGTHKNNL